MTNMTLQALRTLVADDAYASSYQSMAHYRGALLRHFDSLAAGLGTSPISCNVHGEVAGDISQSAPVSTPIEAVQQSEKAAAANAGGQVPDGFELVPVAANVDEVVSRMYRRFKEWSKRGFGPEDVTWCEVRADVLAMIAKANAEGAEGVRHPGVATLADSLQRQNPSWSRIRALTEAKAKVTEGGEQRAAATSAGEVEAIDQAAIDKHLDAVLRASGSALRHYSMQKTLDDMRAAMRTAMDRTAAMVASEQGGAA